MPQTTTIKVRPGTRDAAKQLSRQLGTTMDEAISRALARLTWETEKDEMRRRALELARDPDDLAEAQAVLAHLESLESG